MKPIEPDPHREWQEAAEQLPASGGPEPPEVALYREVYRALRSAEVPEPPAAFAAEMEKLARRRDRAEALEEAGVCLGTVILGFLCALGVASALRPWLAAWGPQGMPVPWLALGAAGASLLAGHLLSRLPWLRRRPRLEAR